MAQKIDLSGNDLVIGNVYAGATSSGSAGTLLAGADVAVIDGITAGTAAASKALVLDSVKGLSWTYTSASTSNSTSVEPLSLSSTLTGIGGVGGRAHFSLTSNVALGGWSNALKGEMTYGAAGRTTGLGSAILAEMTMSAGTTSGTYAPLEIELNLGSNAPVGTQTSFIYASANGTATLFNANGGALSLNGLTISAGNILQAVAKSGVVSTHALRVFINNVAYYIPLNTAATLA